MIEHCFIRPRPLQFHAPSAGFSPAIPSTTICRAFVPWASIILPERKRSNARAILGDGIEGTDGVARLMTEQNRKYVTKEIGKLLSEIWRIKGLAEQEYGPQHPITKKLASMHADAQALLHEKHR